MNLDDIKQLVKAGESEVLELKKSTGQRVAAIKTVCAMLNGEGGTVAFGVTDRGKIIGQEVSSGTLDDINSELRKIDPPAFPVVEVIDMSDRTGVIVIHVTNNDGPFLYDGRAYLRHGSSTIIMPREEFENRLIERMHATRRWENQPVPGEVTLSDLDEEEIQLTLDNAVMAGRMDSPKRRDINSILLGLGLIIKGKLVNAAVALYGNPGLLESLYPQFAVRLARFRGINHTIRQRQPVKPSQTQSATVTTPFPAAQCPLPCMMIILRL